MDARFEASSRLTAFGNQLVEVHIWLRERLADLGDDVDAYLDGAGPPLRDLSAVMETHFGYEERKLLPVLNSMDVPRWRADRPAFLLTEDDQASQ